ncbi:anti-sigma factor domain-containing protein [Marinococcus sp. PL1-022]|uniref:anti-sigma factor n=1 Tax=Marinococcus sp. PL1-022 TaxID=3095363 RepID=UPI0029C2CE03|nr:anti-sigma factor [Marinococcus sp. PL1-022]MDX6153765.1 anti-sigma factor [Marinococcus sp. PL1-022]
MASNKQDWLFDYINGLLNSEEEREFEAWLETDEETRQELEEMQAIMGELPQHIEPQDPPAGMKNRVMEHVVGREPKEEITTAKPKRKWSALAGALAAVLLASIGTNVYLGTQWQQAAEEREELAGDLGEMQTALSELEDSSQQTGEVIASQEFAATENSQGSGTVTLLNTEQQGEMAVHVEGLEDLENSEVYQVWMVGGDQTVPAGSFTTNENGSGSVVVPSDAVNEEWDAVAITREPQPNNETPQGEMVLEAPLS